VQRAEQHARHVAVGGLVEQPADDPHARDRRGRRGDERLLGPRVDDPHGLSRQRLERTAPARRSRSESANGASLVSSGSRSASPLPGSIERHGLSAGAPAGATTTSACAGSATSSRLASAASAVRSAAPGSPSTATRSGSAGAMARARGRRRPFGGLGLLAVQGDAGRELLLRPGRPSDQQHVVPGARRPRATESASQSPAPEPLGTSRRARSATSAATHPGATAA
jgi:hypothetical protein